MKGDTGKKSFLLGREYRRDALSTILTLQLWFADLRSDLNNKRKHFIKHDTKGEKEVL